MSYVPTPTLALLQKQLSGGLVGLGLAESQFGPVMEVPREELRVDPKRFQNRQKEYSEESVRNIVARGFDKSQDPIKVWRAGESDPYIVISGHSRFEASRRLYEDGDSDLATLPVQMMMGGEQEAIEYAKVHANRTSTQESLYSDIEAYKLMKSKKKGQSELLDAFKHDAVISKLRDLSELHVNGPFMQMLKDRDDVANQTVQRARWAGQLRRAYPTLTNSHEREIFDFLIKNGEPVKKDKFFEMIQNRVQNIAFEADKPLNLYRKQPVNQFKDNAQQEIEQLKSELEDMQQRQFKAQRDKAKLEASGRGDSQKAKDLAFFLSNVNTAINRKGMEIFRKEENAKRISNQVTDDLFSATSEPAPAPAPAAPKPKPEPKPEPKPATPSQNARQSKVTVKSKAKGQGGTMGLFEGPDGQLYKSIERTTLKEDSKVRQRISAGIKTLEYEALSQNQDIKSIPKVGKEVNTTMGTAFEIETLKPVEKGSLTVDEMNRLKDDLLKLNERGVYVMDVKEIMRRNDGTPVLVDFSNTPEDGKSRQEKETLIDENTRPLFSEEAIKAYNQKSERKRMKIKLRIKLTSLKAKTALALQEQEREKNRRSS